jgi:hypothetical protein
MEERRNDGVGAAAVLGLLLAVGLAAAGYAVGRGLFAARASEQFVTVRGLSERDVRADLAIWPIVFSATGNDLSGVQEGLEASAQDVYRFLSDKGFEPSEWSLSSPRVTDYVGQGMRREDGLQFRYMAEATIAVRSGKIDGVQKAIQESGELVKAGVAMIRSYEFQTQFLFTGLEAVKPEMIAEATRDARRAAEQFAEDSGSRVGAIRRAQQGYFSIDDRDPFSPDWKKVRVVTTVDFFLADD